jgi:small conductance mechanosensitive channel
LKNLLRKLGLKDSGMDLAKAEDSVRRRSTLLKLTYTFASFAMWLIGLLMILSLLGINVAPLLAGAGVAGIAIGFGAQSLVQDILAGIFILLDEKVRVGDVLQVNGVGGVVERLDLRTLTLRDFNGDAHIVNWGKIDRLTNLTLHWSRVVLEVGVAYEHEPDMVIAVLQEVANALHADAEWADYFLEEPQVLGIANFGDSAIIYRLTVRVRAAYQWTLSRELRRRIWYAFRDHGIAFPYPHLTHSFTADSSIGVQIQETVTGPDPRARVETPRAAKQGPTTFDVSVESEG